MLLYLKVHQIEPLDESKYVFDLANTPIIVRNDTLVCSPLEGPSNFRLRVRFERRVLGSGGAVLERGAEDTRLVRIKIEKM